jgi:hypothetical protein
LLAAGFAIFRHFRPRFARDTCGNFEIGVGDATALLVVATELLAGDSERSEFCINDEIYLLAENFCPISGFLLTAD